MQQEALNTLQLLYREAGGPDALTGAPQQQEVSVQDAPAPVQLSFALPGSTSSHQQGPVDLSEGQLVQPLPRPPSLMSPATLKAVGLGPPSQPSWSFQHATSGVFAPVHELPGSRVAPALGNTASAPQSQPPALPRPAEGHPLSSSSGSLQLSCQLPPGSRWLATAPAAHLKPAQPSEGTSSDVPPSGSTHRGAASDEGVASGGDSRGVPSQQQLQQGLGPSMRQVDSESSLAQQDGSSSDREEGAAKRRRTKKSRLVWTPELHQRFINAVTHLGVKNAVPKTILQLMNVDGMTRENVASHLQKYRQQLRRMEPWGSEPQVPQSTSLQMQMDTAPAGGALPAGLYGLPKFQAGNGSSWAGSAPSQVPPWPAGPSELPSATPLGAPEERSADPSAPCTQPIFSFKRSDLVPLNSLGPPGSSTPAPL